MSEELRRRTRVTSEGNENIFWIVDWDIPLTRNRYRFYRDLAKLKKELGLHGKMSSMSVLITTDGYLAHRVYELASRYASKINIYRGVKER